MSATCATAGCPRPALRYGLHCPECEREIVAAIEATHGPLVGAPTASSGREGA